MAILNYFILGYFQQCEVIVSYFWLLKAVSPYIIIGYSKLYYHKLFVAIGTYSIDVYIFYWWLFIALLLMVIILVDINGYFNNGYC